MIYEDLSCKGWTLSLSFGEVLNSLTKIRMMPRILEKFTWSGNEKAKATPLCGKVLDA
jgi:hypothetical protein